MDVELIPQRRALAKVRENTLIEEVQAVAVSKTEFGFPCFWERLGRVSLQAPETYRALRHLHPFFPMHPIKLAA